MRFPHFFIERPIFAVVLSILILVFGAVSYPTLPVAPGYVAETITVGGAISGYCATGRVG